MGKFYDSKYLQSGSNEVAVVMGKCKETSVPSMMWLARKSIILLKHTNINNL
jgi:hypothetical protein